LRLELSPQPVKLSEVRLLDVKVTLTNMSKRPVELQFPTEQRIEIYLLNSTERVLTKWSDNHAFAEKPGSILINPDEHIEYNEKIATRDLSPNTVFIVDVFFPRYPDLRIRQKFLTAP
jgi:intracellular proteinase inhibitor BsuPI